VNAPGPIRKQSLVERAATVYDFEQALRRREHNPDPARSAPPEAVVPAEDEAAVIAPAPPARHQPSPQRLDVGAVDRRHLAEAGCIDPDAPVSAIAEEYRAIKRGLLAGAPVGEQGLALLVTSAQPGDGKTFTAVNLALSLASEHGLDILLVDGDVLNPSVPSVLGLHHGPGLVDALRDGTDPEALVVATDVPRLSVLRAGPRVPHLTELLASDHAKQFFAGLRRPGRILVIDTPPLLSASPAPVLARHADRVLLVVRADQTGEGALREAVELLGEVDLRLVLNGASQAASQSRFGTYYGAHP